MLDFAGEKSDVIAGFGIKMPNVQEALSTARNQGLPVVGNTVTICETRFELSA